jgi:hypothetical protein
MSKYNLQDLLEGMSDKEFADAQEKDRLEKHPERDKIKAIQALLAKEKLKKESTGPSDKAETEDDVVNVDKVAGPSAKGVGYGAETSANTAEDDQEDKEIQNPPPMYEDMKLAQLAKKLGIDLDDLENRIKSMKSSEKDKIEADSFKKGALAEDRKDLYKGGLSDRIEGLLNQPLKRKFLDMGMDLIQDLLEEDPFDIDDVVNHLAAELGKYYDDFLGAGERLSKIDIDENGDAEDFTKELKEDVAEEESVADYLMDYYRNPNKPEETMVDEKIVSEYFNTHEDWDMIWGKSYEDGLEDFQEFFDANYGYMFPSAGEIDEDLKKQFKRFM